MTNSTAHTAKRLVNIHIETQQQVTETDTMTTPRPSRPTDTLFPRNARRGSIAVAALGMAALLAGCATGVNPNGGAGAAGLNAGELRISGTVYGGQAPIIGATVQLYTVGTTGIASASSGLIASPPTTQSPNGSYSIAGLYNACAANSSTGAPAGTEVYLVATGGNSGSNGTNSDIALATALGDCTTVYNAAQAGTLGSVKINEATTIAAAYALAPFATNLTHVGATGTEPTGLQNAFASAAMLASYNTGASPGGSLATGVTVPAAEINTLADILASCVNSNGNSTPGDGSACGTLFSATGVSTNTFDAAIQIAKKPGKAKIVALYSMVGTQAPFQPTLSSQPNDFSVALTYAGSGNLAAPWGIAIDASGNAWVTNESGSAVNEFTPSGTENTVAITASGLYGAQGIAIDQTGNVWVANTVGNSVVKFPAGNVSSPSSFTGGGISGPSAIAIDAGTTVWIANLNGNSVTSLSNTGTVVNGGAITSGGLTVPTAIAIAPSGGFVYIASGSGSSNVVVINNNAGYIKSLTDGALTGPQGLAFGGTYLAVSGFTTGSTVTGALSEFNSSGTAQSFSPATSGLNFPAGVASDGASFFVANGATSGGLAQFLVASGTPASPAGGYNTLNTPVGVAVDSSGSVWTANSGTNTVSKFIGLAVPTATPLVANVGY